ncbi:MAG: hypothetical protein U0Q18_18560 [Bryobacteraceae bacterium]
MRRLIQAVLLAAILAALMHAQYGPRGGPYYPDRVDALIERVHTDLERGYGVWRLSGGDRDRLTHAEHQLRDFAKHWHRGHFDKDKLDDSIAAVQHVLDNNHLTGRERDMLWQDVTALRRMREAYDRHEIGRW